ncbi:DNA ligase-like protein 3 [Elsinoe australis]|uniref:DNA ligase n=1 Tax=Elsinoe australis TaxID=40998 RepID=A0A4U7AZC6_9PEZI|nr:DNA ligase-like protein 3 [Elsinoe australis]
MAPGQSTLGKFFGNQNGGKAAAPQQSKLAFSKKAEVKKDSAKQETVKDEAADEVKPKTKQTESTDVEMNNGQNGTSKADTSIANDSDEDVKPPRKRSIASAASTASDDEPPTKKQRKKPAPQLTSPTAKASKSSKIKIEDDEDDAPVKTKKAANGSSKDVKGKKAPVPPGAEEDSDKPEQDSVTSDAESDHEAEESDEEKPELAAKEREKIQSTLKSTTKDPYPDWRPGEPVPYVALCTTFSLIEMTTKRLEIMAHCSLFLRQVLRLTPDDLLPTVFLMLGKLAADYSGVELGIGESLIMKAIGETTGRSLAIIKTDQQEIGDLGLVAAKSRSNQPTMFKPKPLTVRGVHKGLMTIATIEGQGSQGRKIADIKKLLSSADVDLAGKGKSGGVDITLNKGGPSESKYIVRTLEGKMRLGLAEKTVLVSLAHAMVWHDSVKKDAKKIPGPETIAKGETQLKNVFNELPSYEVIIPAYLKHGIFKLREACNLQPGVPLKPMLARPTKSITEVLDRFEGKDFTCEYKYDGERAQIHFVAHSANMNFATAVAAAGKSERGVSNIFSRNSEDLSKKYPDILAKLPTWVKEGTTSFVLDCETVAWDVNEKKVLPFQQLMTRKRKDVKTEDIKVKVCVFAFDLLYLNGSALVNRSFRERRELMVSAFAPVEGEFAFAQYQNTSELEEIQTLLEESVKASCEGLMVKMLDGESSYYEPSRRSQNWLKVKKDYLAGAGDSLDLVVLGAYYGKGKRTSVFGAFLLACYNQASQEFETVCNIGTGFSEEMLAHLHEILSPIEIEKPKPFYSHSAGNKDQPDVWFEPRFVWEVKTADLTLSPRYKAAAGSVGDPQGRGVSLRFPRFIREREDKKPEDATSARQVAGMYKDQMVVSGQKKGGPAVDDDFEY